MSSDWEQPTAPPAKAPEIMSMTWLLRFKTRSADHRGANEKADADNYRRADDGRGDVFVLQNFVVQLSWCDEVKDFVADNGQDDAEDGEGCGLPDSFAESPG